MPPKSKKSNAPIVDEETVWWFAETMKFNPDSMMHKICQSHESMRAEISELRLIIREFHNFLSLDITEQAESERQYLIEKTKKFMPMLVTQVLKKPTPGY